jgi:ribosome-associated protein
MPVTISENEVEFSAIRAQGPGGQNVNKVSCAVHLRFDIRASSLPADVKERLLLMPDQRVTRDGIVVIKAQNARSLEKNRIEALRRLQALVDEASQVQAIRRPTKPTYGSRLRRLEGKARRAGLKVGRAKISE